MTAAPPPATPTPSPGEQAAGVFAGFALLALVNACMIVLRVPLPSDGVGLRLWHLLFDASETLGLGAVAALAVGAFAWFARRIRLPGWARYIAGFVTATVIIHAAIGAYLALQSVHALSGKFTTAILVNDFVLLGVVFVAGPTFAWRLAGHPKLRVVPAVAGAALMIADHVPLRDDYFAIHCLAATGAALVAGPPLARPLVRLVARLSRTSRGRGLLAAGAIAAVAGLAVPPSNAVRQQLFRQPCAVAPWILATVAWRPPALHGPVQVPASEWLDDRSRAPLRPPTSPRLLPENPVVVLITIDALRAEALYDASHDALLPTFAAMKREGVVFLRASTPGAQTPTSLSTMFTGRYFSEERWEEYGQGADRFPYPARDPSPRFPELLAAHGVTTVTFAAFVFLVNDFGVARGFREEKSFGRSRAAAAARFLTTPMVERLGHAGDEPLFVYAHFGEPHAPYVFGRAGAPAHDRYLAAVAEADKQVGRIQHVLEERFGDRWVLIVSSDHGEAFGEHQTTDHSKTLYEELLHVPLIVRSPRLSHAEVDQRVGLIDLGPTILDLFGTDTPATSNGQSLVPILMGRHELLTRPLLAEGRLSRSYTQVDGLKVIDDPRRKVVEVYDLATDPGETRNLFDSDPARADPPLAFLRAFYAAHALRADGYEPPYKP
jgi:arylsulfatase A-like enzyme